MALPVSWQAIGGLFFLIVAAAIFFLSIASYSRIETVTGIIVPEGGVAQIVPTRPGVIESLSVSQGQQIASGERLALIRTGEDLAGGGNTSAQILASLSTQENDLRLRQKSIRAAEAAERQQLSNRIAGLEAEIASLNGQIGVQQGLVETARRELERARPIVERGFISRQDLLQREETFLLRQQQLGQMQQTLATRRAAISEAQAAMRQTSAANDAQIAALSGERSDILQRRTSAEASDAYSLAAPIAGAVTALTARSGQAVTPQSPIMLIVPSGSELRAELYVPSAAIGFLEVGQEVSLAPDAFPYQRFGTVPGRILDITNAPVVQSDNSGVRVPVYIVTVAMEQDSIEAYGNEEELIAGMTLTARITTEEQSLIRWLFEPLFAVGKR
ncbi:HlyD family secretion protein [Alteripontixanthobacter maritimus]|nr:HlyD family efflux transporter periplasmic adaptor subunit [Alteripontixanthobacter maritimus]